VALTIAGFVLITTASQILSAEEDLVHIVSGVVKHVDKDTKSMVVKTSEGTEQLQFFSLAESLCRVRPSRITAC
jgi:hypothetical protein